MTGPYGTGGGGFRFEDRVAAYYLVSILTETASRGLVGEFAVAVRTQRAALGEPLDDLIVDGRVGSNETRLSLQLKSQVSFNRSNAEWAETVRRAWDTVATDGFDASLHRVGIGTATFSAKADAHYRTVLNWARDSDSAEDFVRRIGLSDFSHATRTAFVEDVKAILADHLGEAPSDHQIWSLLRSLVILHFDFNADASSGDDAAAVGTLQSYLQGADRARARDVWNALDSLAGRIIPSAGGLDRETLVERLLQEGLPVGVQSTLREDVAAIDAESRRALREIRSTIGDLRLHRVGPIEEFANSAAGNRFVQFVSEPGAGKSAVLREIAERYGAEGPLFVLKNDRIHPRGWPAHASNLRVSGNLDEIINAFAAAGNPVLFIDGIDRVTDPAAQVTVNDVLRAITDSPTASAWLVVVTVREQNLRHLETWLDRVAIEKLGVRSITIPVLSANERTVIADAVPRLGPLFRDASTIDVLLSRPFFLEAILRLSPASGELPASEAELLDLWWELGGSHDAAFAAAQRRRDTLIALANQAAISPNTPLSIAGLDAAAIEELRAADVLRDQSFGHSMHFTHDIYEEWALAELVLRHEADLPGFLQTVGEPQTLVRATQLVGTRTLEHDRSGDSWLRLLAFVQQDDLRPVWHRSILTAPLHSTRTTDLLSGLSDQLFALDNGLLQKLLTALQTIEVVPNPTYLENDALDLDYEMRVKLAHHAALPKARIWLRFLEWMIPQLESLPLAIVPDLVPVLATWQNGFGGYRIKFCREIGIAAHTWLKEAEEAFHPVRFEDRREPFGPKLSYEKQKKLEKDLRALLLASAGDAPNNVASYLAEHLADDRHLHMVREEIVAGSIKLAQFLPKDLVDFILAAFVEKPRKHHGMFPDDESSILRHYGFADDQVFYPSSPLKPPFLALLRSNPDEGLRLVHGLAKLATDHWRRGYARRKWTPIPLDLVFPWGPQRFWGDGTTYGWFRGVNGPEIVESALMALEQWSFEELERGVSIETQLEKILKGSECVAFLGVAISLLLSVGNRSVPLSLPLIMQPRIWAWDISRSVGDLAGNGNEIGNWLSDRVFLEAVRKLNQMPHRQFDIRSLVAYYCLADVEVQARYQSEWSGFEANLPFDIEEEKEDEEHVAALAEKNRISSQQADLKNFVAVQAADGKGWELHMNPPYAAEDKHQQTLAQQAKANAAMGLAMWAEKTREHGTVDARLSLADALRAAQETDSDGLFDRDDEAAFEEARYAVAGIVGTASAVARHWPIDNWDDEIGQWCLTVLQRGATQPERSHLGGRSSLAIMSPQVFAAYGYSALLARGYEVERAKIALLNLSVDAMETVEAAVYESAGIYAEIDPAFAYLLLELALRRCLREDGDFPDHYSVAWSESEAARELEELEQSERAMASPRLPSLPRIPLPWIEDHTAKNKEGYARNPLYFDHRRAEKTLLNLPSRPLIADPALKDELIRLTRDLIAYTGQQILPPFAKSTRDHRTNKPFEWIYTFSAWCGRLMAALDDQTSTSVLVEQIQALPNEAPWHMLEHAMRAFMLDALLKPAVVEPHHRAIWEKMTSWVFDNPQAQWASSNNHIDREFQACAFATMFCAGIEFRGVLCGAERGWANIKQFEDVITTAVTRFGTHETLFLGVVKLLQAGGIAFFPEPALGWLRSIALARRSDQAFWDSNGDGMVEILRAAISNDASLTRSHGAKIMFIADVLVDNGVRGAGFLQQELSKQQP